MSYALNPGGKELCPLEAVLWIGKWEKEHVLPVYTDFFFKKIFF